MRNVQPYQYDRQSRPESRQIDDTYVFDPASGVYKPKTCYQEAKRKRVTKIFKSWTPVVFSGLTLLLLWKTVNYTRLQWSEMKRAADAAQNTLREIQKQTTLMRQQLVGSQSAIVEFYAIPELHVNSLGEATDVTLNIANNGQIITRNIPVHVEITRLTWPGQQQIGNTRRLEWTIPALPPMKPNIGPTAKVIPYALSPEEMKSIELLHQTIKVSGGLAYDNGFGDKTAWDFCYYFLGRGNLQPGGSGNFVDCDVFPIARQDALRENARQNAP